MGKGGPKVSRKRVSPANSPINFRMPRPLRLRLHKFASARHLSEAEALRVVVSERLDELEATAELAAAERWQYAQAYATWDRFRRGEGRTVPRERIQEIFTHALAQPPEHAEQTA